MMHIFINKLDGNTVGAIVNEVDPSFPDIPITERYSEEFLEECIQVAEEDFEALGIRTGMVYDFETGEFSEPEITPQPDPEPEAGYSVSQEEVDAAYAGGVEDVE